MKTSPLGWVLLRCYTRLPGRRRLLGVAVGLEGGQMTSLTLRAILTRYHGVQLGSYSYGSLAEPGRADRATTIGRYVSVGPDVRRFGASHPMEAVSMHPYWYNPSLGYATDNDDVKRSECEIGHDSWIGAGTVILPGCRRIGVGAVVGAASVVVDDIPDFAVVVGNPARIVKYRFDEDLRNEILLVAPWQHEPDLARAAMRDIVRGRAV